MTSSGSYVSLPHVFARPGKWADGPAQRSIARLGLALAIFIVGSCAASPPHGKPLEDTAGQRHATMDVSGLWQGTTRVLCIPGTYEPGRCDAVNKIIFSILQEDHDLSGRYRCQTGNMVCRNEGITNSGAIKGTLEGQRLSFRVYLPGDGSSCLYSGRMSYTSAGGTYNCYQGAGLVETGQWHVNRE